MRTVTSRCSAVAALAAAAIGLSAESASACGCVQSPVCAVVASAPPFRAADAVFVGEVLAHSSIETRIRVERMFVGDPSQEVTLGPLVGAAGKTGRVMSSCDQRFTVGKRYLVFAHRHSETNDLVTSSCSRNTLIPDVRASADLAYLEARARRLPTNGWVSGIVEEGSYATGEWVGHRLAGVRLIATPPAGERKVAYTNSEGIYTFTGLTPAWRVTADLPPPFLPHDGMFGRRDESETRGVPWIPGLTCAQADIHVLRKGP